MADKDRDARAADILLRFLATLTTAESEALTRFYVR